MPYVLAILGMVLLYYGGEVLVKYAVGLARRLGLSPLVIGLTVVAFGTSAPELAASMTANLSGSPEIAMGNVVGSCIANLGLILGIAALIHPLRSVYHFTRREVPFMVAVSGLLGLLAWDGAIGRVEGGIFIFLLVAYLARLARTGRDFEQIEGEDGEDGAGASMLVTVLGILGGCVLLVGGAEALVSGAVDIARSMGVPERVIGLSLVAVGTSLPELASSVAAARRGEGQLILGNVVGSNLFNILAILGPTALVQPVIADPSAVRFDAAINVGFAGAALVALALRSRIARPGGAAFIIAYGLYIGWLFYNP